MKEVPSKCCKNGVVCFAFNIIRLLIPASVRKPFVSVPPWWEQNRTQSTEDEMLMTVIQALLGMKNAYHQRQRKTNPHFSFQIIFALSATRKHMTAV